MVVTRKGWPLEFNTFKQRRYLRKGVVAEGTDKEKKDRDSVRKVAAKDSA